LDCPFLPLQNKGLDCPQKPKHLSAEDLTLFAATFNRLSGRHDESTELIRYIQNKQKAKRRLPIPWPVFEGNHQRAPALSGTLDDEEMEALRGAYEQVVLPLHLGTDALLWNEEVVSALATEFLRRTGRIVPGFILVAIAEEKRKRKLWFTVGRGGDRDLGNQFDDLDDVEDL
jgi:hypothetical protein